MFKLLKVSAFLGLVVFAADQAKADVIDALSNLKVKVTVEEEPFTGEAYSLFSTDECSAFAIQQTRPMGQKQIPPKSSSGTISDLKGLVEDLVDLDNILNGIEKIGARVWRIIEANRPVVSTQSQVANALPKNVSCWMDLENWQVPKSYKYNVKYSNLFGMDVVNFTFRVLYTYGASYMGRGQYLSNVSVHPAELDVMWGYTFNSKVIVERLINLGTKENPVAGMEMKLTWQISTPMKDSQQTETFFVSGNGEFKRQ